MAFGGSHIPVIDIGKISLTNVDVPSQEFDAVGKDFCHALSTWGFAYLTNHGIPWDCFGDCVGEASKFFALNREAKLRHSRGALSIDGYSEMGREVLQDDVVECKESFDVASFSGRGFPPEVPRLKVKCHRLAHQCIVLGRRLLRCMAADLGTDWQDFQRSHSRMFAGGDGNATSLRILRYPAVQDAAAGAVSGSAVTRCGAHTDYGGLTLLFQDSIGGLEIQDLEGRWIKAEPMQGAIVVNIGDLMAFWSGNRYKATMHRVVYGEGSSLRDRYSVAFFAHPNHDAKLIPFGKGEDGGSTAVLTAREHVQRRFADTYGKK